MSALEYKKEVRRVVDYVLSGGELNTLTQDEKRLLKFAYDNKYIEGLVFETMISGRIICEIRHDPKPTLGWAEFLDSLEAADNPHKNIMEKTESTVGFVNDLLSALSHLGPVGKLIQKLFDLL